jgi:hypothetical protein
MDSLTYGVVSDATLLSVSSGIANYNDLLIIEGVL